MDVIWPAKIIPDSFSLSIAANSNSYKSVFTGASQTAAFPGTTLKLTMGFKDLTSEESKLVMSFLVKMNGMSGRTQLSDRTVRSTPVQGTPAISGATGNLTTLASKGWTPSVTVLTEGSYISFGTADKLELKIVTADVVSDSSGNAIIPVGPWIRNYPVTNSAIEVANPVGRFRLVQDENGKSADWFDRQNYSLEFVEAFYD